MEPTTLVATLLFGIALGVGAGWMVGRGSEH